MEFPNCPWSALAPGTTAFCEARLCAWVESPGIAWAGIVYVAMATLIFRDLRAPDSWRSKTFAWVTLSMGLSSAAFHSTHALVFQAWDVGSMFGLAALMLVANLVRIRPALAETGTDAKIYIGLLVAALSLFAYRPNHPGVSTFGVFLAAALLLEIPAARRTPGFKYGNFRVAAAVFAVAFAALRIEKTSLCDPQNHFFQWHAVWDAAAAVCYFLLYRHYRQSA